MDDANRRYWEIFLEVFEALPRQGPGHRAGAVRALDLCRDLPPAPAVLDLGCGVGAQTFHLAELVHGSIVAVDSHAPCIDRLRASVTAQGLSDRIQPVVGDMARLDLPGESFDLVWSEGALYNIGIAEGLRVAHDLLRPGGYLAFTDAVWRKEDPPAEVQALFQEYPAMGWAADVLALIEAAGFDLVGQFTLPDEAWWEDFYTPLVERVQYLRTVYTADGEALAALDRVEQEADIHRQYGEYYAYEFFIARRPLLKAG